MGRVALCYSIEGTDQHELVEVLREENEAGAGEQLHGGPVADGGGLLEQVGTDGALGHGAVCGE